MNLAAHVIKSCKTLMTSKKLNRVQVYTPMKSLTLLFITCSYVMQIVQNKTRTELVFRLRVEKDCQNYNRHNVIY